METDCGPSFYIAHGSPTSEWAAACGGEVPPKAFEAGYDVDGTTLYVGHAEHEGSKIPGKVVPQKGCYISHGGQEHLKETYKVLCTSSSSKLEWVATRCDSIPNGALQGGITCDGEPLYIGRVQHEGSYTPGKVQRSHGVLYFPFGGGEHPAKEYEVLTVTTQSSTAN